MPSQLRSILSNHITRSLIGLTLGMVFLYLAIREIDLTKLDLSSIELDWWHIIAALAIYSIELLIRALRWKLLVDRIQVLSMRSITGALVVGYAFNNILPARLGEVMRADFLGSRHKLPRMSLLATIVLERTLDGVVVVGALFLGMALWHPAPVLITAGLIGITLFGVISIMIYIIAHEKSEKLPHLIRFSPFIEKHFTSFRNGLTEINLAQVTLQLLPLTIAAWALQSIALYYFIEMAGMELSIEQMLVLLGIISLSTLIPTAPGFIGTYQYAYVLVAGLFGYTAINGVVAATLVQIFMMGYVTIGGLLLYFLLGTALRRHHDDEQPINSFQE